MGFRRLPEHVPRRRCGSADHALRAGPLAVGSPNEEEGSMGAAALWLLMLLVVIVSIAAIVDAVRRRDLTGGAKALWIVLIVILPLIGTIIYVIARPKIGD